MSSVLPTAGPIAGTIDSTIERLRDEVADASTMAHLASGSPDGLARLTLSGRFTDLNPAVERLLGWYPEVLRGRALCALAHPGDRQGCELRLARLVAACEAGTEDPEERILMRARRVDAHWSWLEVHLRCERDQAGRPAGLVAALRSVDERHGAHLMERRRTGEHAAMHRIGLGIARGVAGGDLCALAAGELVGVLGGQAALAYRAEPGSGTIECLASAWRDEFGDAHTDALDEPLDADGPAARAIAT
ncbi:MAG: PAS domain S-box protein, partial [Miltoncostaeaceae bacterium]